MVVREAFKLLWCEHVGQETEYLCVRELDVVLTLLQSRIVQSDDAGNYTQVAGLLRLILELDDVHWDKHFNVHAFTLTYVKELTTICTWHHTILFPTSYRNIFHHEVNPVVYHMCPFTVH